MEQNYDTLINLYCMASSRDDLDAMNDIFNILTKDEGYE